MIRSAVKPGLCKQIVDIMLSVFYSAVCGLQLFNSSFHYITNMDQYEVLLCVCYWG